MDEKPDLKTRFFTFLRKNVLLVGLLVVSLILVGIGIFQYLKPQDVKIDFTKADGGTIAGEKTTGAKIMVDVGGAVVTSGVYALGEGARLQDALIAAGGMSATADREYVAKRLNLAQKLSDGVKIYIPAVGEVSVVGVSSSSTLTAGSSGTTSSGGININTATQAELESLPKIGPATAAKIINGRPYNSTSELVSKKALSQKTYDAIKDLITTL